MNLSKSLEFFDPINDLDAPIHVIGVGAMGSRVVELLVRLGIPKIHIWDMDTVEDKNITNQLYFTTQIGKSKTEALTEIIHMINPTCEVKQHGEYTEQALAGYVFLCVDSIELRHKIATAQLGNPNIKGMFDTRMRLEDAQSYGANWKDETQRKTFISSMEFTDEEAQEATPVSACGTTLSVASTVVSTAAFTVSNFMNLVRTKQCKTMIFVDAFKHTTVTL